MYEGELQMREITDYDRRLFTEGLRRRIHESRFHWLRRETQGLSGSVIEIGCFNARSLRFLSFTPERYLGLDAGWEGGLDEAIIEFPQYKFLKSIDPNDIQGSWDVALALETLEHIPRPDTLDVYLENLAQHSNLLIATVPMEIGPLFAAKFLYKKFVHGYAAQHSFAEFIDQSLGRCERVTQDNHRGFDYRYLVRRVNKHFRIQKVEGINASLPRFLNTQIGIRAVSRYI
jgi:hypothetical protein